MIYCLLSDPFTSVDPSLEVLTRLPLEFNHTMSPIRTQAMVCVIYLVSNILSPVIWGDTVGICISVKVKSDSLPIGAGLGSSAAFSVATAGACLKVLNSLRSNKRYDSVGGGSDNKVENSNWYVPDQSMLKSINGWAFAAEILNHLNPSGLDNAVRIMPNVFSKCSFH